MHLLILLHGINQANSVFKGLEKLTTKNGFAVLNIDYPSTIFSIEEIVEIMDHQINPVIKGYKLISFVGFSLGGLIVRAYLNKYKLSNLGKVVLVGVPNKGSEVADFLRKNKLYKKLYGPSGQQLTTTFNNSIHVFGKPYYECGIISGNLALDFWGLILRGQPNDGKVTVNSTKIEGAKDHIILNLPHWFLPRSSKVHKNILYFLKNSKFNHLDKGKTCNVNQ